MSESGSTTTSAASEPNLDEIADELYAMHPDAFAAARDERVRQARAEGQPALARELARLRKPTLSAWLINLLWRDQREVIQQLFDLSDEMSRAQAAGSGAELRNLMAQRREVEGVLIRQARALAERAGVKVSDATAREAQDTLGAALARPEVADEVRTGRLVKPATYAGFGVLPSAAPAAPPAAQAEKALAAKEDRQLAATARRESAPAHREPDDFQARANQRARERRAAAERRVEEARADVEAAAEALAAQQRAADAAQQRHQALGDHVEQLQEQLRDLKAELAAAEQSALAAGRRVDQADKAHAALLAALERAEKELDD